MSCNDPRIMFRTNKLVLAQHLVCDLKINVQNNFSTMETGTPTACTCSSASDS